MIRIGRMRLGLVIGRNESELTTTRKTGLLIIELG